MNTKIDSTMKQLGCFLASLAISGSASAFVIDVTDPVIVVSSTVGIYTTTLVPEDPVSLAAGSTQAIRNLYEVDYPNQTYVAGGARNGTLTISTLDVFQTGTQGGLDIVASFDGDAAANTYRWLQYIDWAPIGAPFRGETASPFTDPPPLDVDDGLPFYWTNTERNNEGQGWVTGANQTDNPLFSDTPTANDSRAVPGTPFTFRLNLFLTDYNATTETVTIYDGVQYGFNISAVPVPAAVWLFGSGLVGLLGLARRKKA